MLLFICEIILVIYIAKYFKKRKERINKADENSPITTTESEIVNSTEENSNISSKKRISFKQRLKIFKHDIASLFKRDITFKSFFKRNLRVIIYIAIAIVVISSFNDTQPFNAEKYYTQAVQEYENGDYKASLSSVKTYLEYEPDDEKAVTLINNLEMKFYEAAVKAFESDDYQTAIDYSEIVLEIHNDNQDAAKLNLQSKELLSNEYYQKALEQFDSGNYANAIDYLTTAITLKENYTEAIELLEKSKKEYNSQQINELLEQIKAYRTEGNYAECLKLANDILAIDAQNQSAQKLVTEFGTIIHNQSVSDLKAKMNQAIQEQNFVVAKTYANQLIELEPDNSEFLSYSAEIDSLEQKNIENTNKIQAQAQAAKKADSLLQSDNLTELKKLYDSSDKTTKEHIKKICEEKAISIAKGHSLSLESYNTTDYKKIYDSISQYTTGFNQSKKITQLLSVINSLYENQVELNQAANATYNGVITSADDIVSLNGIIQSRVRSSTHFSIGGFDITDKYTDEYLFTSHDGSYQAVLLYKGSISSGAFSVNAVFAGNGTYRDSDGFDKEMEKWQFVSENEINNFYTYINKKNSVPQYEAKKTSYIKKYQSILSK